RSTVRVRVVNSPAALVLEQCDPSGADCTLAGAAWLPVSQIVPPSEVQLCGVVYPSSLDTTAISPTCPATSELWLRYTSGTMQVVNTASTIVCPATGSAACAAGAAVPLSTVDGGHHYKIYVYGLTGMPRLLDQW